MRRALSAPVCLLPSLVAKWKCSRNAFRKVAVKPIGTRVGSLCRPALRLRPGGHVNRACIDNFNQQGRNLDFIIFS